MRGNDWNDLGNDLSRIIEDAVHGGNFGRLNETIDNTVKRAFRSITGEEFRAGDGWDFDLSGNAGRDGRNQASQTAQAAGTEQTAGNVVPTNRMLFAGGGKRKGGSWGMVAGGCVAIVLGFIFLMIFLAGSAIGLASLGIGFFIAALPLMIGGAVLTVLGAGGLKLSKKFEQHIRSLDGEEYADIRKLSLYCHRSEAAVLKEIRKMLKKGWFVQGHLDRNGKCLMVTNDAYEQYLEAVKNAKLREEESKRKKEEETKRNGGLTEEVRAVLKKGNEYIESIRKSNDAIPGERISEKIYRMELLVKRIFQQTEAHPENAEDLDRLMEYYLPMTIKLLKAYEELDGQPVQGENIVSSKKEIEDTLDTLNVAYARMLDNLFQDTAWDVSSDISVLQTLLAQEGLTDDGFARNKNQ